MNIRLKTIMISVIVCCGLLGGGCDKYFGIDTEDVLQEPDHYVEKSSVYAGMVGLSASFRSVAEHHIILTELLGDLMEPTEAAPDEFWDIYRYKADNSCAFASPAPYYKLVMNCNDFFKHAITYNKTYPGAIAPLVYKGMLSSALTYRAWAYLQIGKLYGEAVYHDLSFVDDNGQMPTRVLKLDELIQELLFNLKTGVDGVNAFQTLDWRTIVSPETKPENFNKIWNRLSINTDALLCELYLWAGDYTNAAKTGLNCVSVAGDAFKLNVFSANDQYNPWFKMFYQKDGLVALHTREVMTLAPFDYNLRQTHKLQYYFSNIPPAVYYFRPNDYGTLRFYMQIKGESEKEGKRLPYRGSDSRMLGTFDYENGEETIWKYHAGKKPHEQDAAIFIYRTAEMYLMIAEALNGLGNNEAADSLMNVGLKNSWKSDHYVDPFTAPIFRSSLNVCPGVRGRANIYPDYVRFHIDSTVTVTPEQLVERKKFVMDSLIGEETALELAYEGKRWFTLMRIARNSNRPEQLAKPISQKFNLGEDKIYERWLMDPKNWFIKWDVSNVLEEINSKK